MGVIDRQNKLWRRAIEHPVRRKILELYPCSIDKLVKELGIEKSVIKNHLIILKRCDAFGSDYTKKSLSLYHKDLREDQAN